MCLFSPISTYSILFKYLSNLSMPVGHRLKKGTKTPLKQNATNPLRLCLNGAILLPEVEMMDTFELVKRRNYNVVKQNELIQQSRYSLTLQQQKILLYFVSLIRPDDPPNTVYSTNVREMCEVCGMPLRDGGYYWTSVKEDVKQIANSSVWIEVGESTETLFRWFDSVTINKGSGELLVSFHRTMAPYLFELKNKYSKYALANVVCLKTKYGIRLYEMLNTMLWAGTMELSIQELRRRLDVDKVKSYDKFTHFKDRVLDPAVEEITQFTNINVSYDLKKTSRAFTDIIFYIDQKSDYEQIIANHSANKRLKG